MDLREGFFGQTWPFLKVILDLHYTVCGKVLELMNTNIIRLLILPLAVLVKISLNRITNLPVTNNRFLSSLVGTSETKRVRSTNDDVSFNQWLAGLIDGDGSLLISKAGYPSCEITVSVDDERMLKIIQNKIGGSIKPRSGKRALRWRLHNKVGMLSLVERINGYIRHTGRLNQLHKICMSFNVPLATPDTLSFNHNWLAGFFDADGTITYSIKNGTPQLTISATNKLLDDVQHFKNILGGYIYYDKSQNGL